jgi:ribosomal protein S18 acetylase RimI-like enzyme
VTRYRAYRNGDSPALAELWSRCLQARPSTRPLTAHEFDALVPGKLGFDREGLLVAELGERLVGFVHAGFGPAEPAGASRALDTSMGAVLVLVIDEAAAPPAAASELLAAALAYLRGRGATVLYAGGQYPVNPFYWGLYGGSELSGIVASDHPFREAAREAGFEPVAESVIFEADLAGPEPRDPRLVLARRQYRVDAEIDATFPSWWDALALGLFRPTCFRLVDRLTGNSPAQLWTWESVTEWVPGHRRMTTGLIRLEVEPSQRRKGLARFLVSEAWRAARVQLSDVLAVQTSATNQPALALYRSLGFTEVSRATLYRLPGP